MSVMSDSGAIRDRAKAYFEEMGRCESDWHKEERQALNMSYYDAGENALRFIEKNYFAVADKTVVDLACRWGGHLIPFAAKGAYVRGIDAINYEFNHLNEFARKNDLNMIAFRGKCDCVPYCDATVDVVLVLDMIEHAESVKKIAAEVARILSPGGLCLVSSPPRLRSIIKGEPHYGLKGFAILPLALQRLVTLRPIGKPYDDPIVHQHFSAFRAMRPFRQSGLSVHPTIEDGRRQSDAERRTFLSRLAEKFLWDMIVLTKDPQTDRLGQSLSRSADEEKRSAQTNVEPS